MINVIVIGIVSSAVLAESFIFFWYLYKRAHSDAMMQCHLVSHMG